MVDLILVAGAMSLVTYLAVRKDKTENLMMACKIKNPAKKVPKIIDTRGTDYGKDVIFHVPEGICLTDFKKRQEAIEQYLGASVELEYIGSQRILMKVLSNELKALYDYVPVKLPGPVEFPLGMSRRGPVTLKLDDSYPSCLVGGTAGSGKSVCLRVIITNCILTKDPAMLKLHLCDLKYGVEFSIFKRSSFVETFAKDLDETINLLYMLLNEMYRRYEVFEKAGVVNIQEYNRRRKPMPYHLLVIDEFANLQESDKSIEMVDCLLRMARAVGIHTVIATQRPDAKTVPGKVKANLQATIAFKTRNDVNSMILLDHPRAADLRGQGHGILQTDNDYEFQGWYLDVKQAQELIRHTYVRKPIKAIQDDTSGVIKIDSAAD